MARGDHGRHSFCRELGGNRSTDALTTSRDNGDFAADAQIHNLLLESCR
jgi:hypothetical protein